jgi:hypothetical protein
MKYSILLAALLTIILNGCASFDAAQTAAATRGAQAADDVRETAEWTLCNGITVGAWRRAYAGDSDRAAGWAALCTPSAGQPK